MGTKGREILGSSVKNIVKLLNSALVDEWYAYYQYWIASFVVTGFMRPDVQKEFEEHADEELKHARMLSERIVQLGGIPVLNIFNSSAKGNCSYLEPKGFDVMKIISQNIKSEQCAILTYNKILEKLKRTKDYVSFNMIREILEDEVEHEQDLEDLLEDIDSFSK